MGDCYKLSCLIKPVFANAEQNQVIMADISALVSQLTTLSGKIEAESDKIDDVTSQKLRDAVLVLQAAIERAGGKPAAAPQDVIPHPKTPFSGKIPHGLRPGLRIAIIGLVPLLAEHFTVDLTCGQVDGKHDGPFDKDVGLHMDADFTGEGKIIFNNFTTAAGWGDANSMHFVPPEGAAGTPAWYGNLPFPLKRGEQFELVIYCGKGHFEIYVNNLSLGGYFYYREPIKTGQGDSYNLPGVTHLLVRHDVKLFMIQFEDDVRNPQNASLYSGEHRMK